MYKRWHDSQLLQHREYSSYNYSGGIVGGVFQGGIITDCYSSGNISSFIDGFTGEIGGGFSGGIAGNIFDGTITNCAAINQWIKALYAGRIVADRGDGNTISNNFARIDMQAAGMAFTTDPMLDGIGKTDADLKTRTTYSDGLGWRFGSDDDAPWKMPAGGGYPILYWQK